MPRYLQAAKSQVSYGIEASYATEAADLTRYFGLIQGDVVFPNPNPYVRHGHTTRKPYARSPEEKSYEFSIETLILDGKTPFQAALGKVTTTSVDPNGSPGSGDEYTKDLFEYDDQLASLSIRRQQVDAGTGLNDRYLGCKAGLNLSWAMGEPVKAKFDFVAAKHVYSEGVGALVNLNVPTTRMPFRAFHQGDVLFKNPSGGATLNTLVTIRKGEITVSPGLTPNHHGKGREAYSVSEDGEPGELFGAKLTIVPEDLAIWKRAKDDDISIDLEVPFDVALGYGANFRQGMILRAKDCKLIDAPLPRKALGVPELEVTLDPLNVEIEVRTPA